MLENKEKDLEIEKYLEEILKASKYYGFKHIGCDCYKYKNVYVELREETITDINGIYEMDYAVFETEEDMNNDYELNIMTDYMAIENAIEFWQDLKATIDRNCIDGYDYNKNLEEDNFYYIVFALGRDLIKDYLPYETDTAYDFCKRVAIDFEKSEYNVNTKGLYECLENYVNDNFKTIKEEKVLYKGQEIK